MNPTNTSRLLTFRAMAVVVLLGAGIVVPSNAAPTTSTNQVPVRISASKTLSICVLPFGNRDESGAKGWYSLVLPDLFSDVLIQSPGITVLDRHAIDNVLNEQVVWGSGLVQEQWAKSTGLIDRADIVLYGSFLLQGTNVSIEVHAMDVTTRRLSAAVTYSGSQDNVPKWIGKGSSELLRQLRGGYTGLESILRSTPRRSLACLENFYTGQIAAEAGDRHRALTHLLKTVNMDPSLAGGHYWLGRTFESWGANDHAFLHYAIIGGTNVNPRTITVEIRDTYDRLLEAKFPDWALRVLANCIRGDSTWYVGMQTYLGRTGELPAEVPGINYLPAVTSSVFGLMLPTNTTVNVTPAVQHPVEYELWESYCFWTHAKFYEDIRTLIKSRLKDGIFQPRYPCFIFTAPPGYVIVAVDFKQQREMGWCAAPLACYEWCMGRGNVPHIASQLSLQPGKTIQHRDSYQNFNWKGRFDRPYKAVFVTGADERVPAEVMFELMRESEVVRVVIAPRQRKWNKTWISWDDRFSYERPPCVIYLNPGKTRFVVQGSWSETGIDPTNKTPSRADCYGNVLYDYEWTKGTTKRLDHDLYVASRRYTPIVEPRTYTPEDQRLVKEYVISGTGWRSVRSVNPNRPALISVVQPFKDTIVACWQSPLQSALPGGGTELLVTIFQDRLTDTEVRQIAMSNLPVLRSMKLHFAPATEDYLLVCSPKDSTNAMQDVYLRSHDLRTWTRCSPQSIAGEKLAGNDSESAAGLWELSDMGPLRRQIGMGSLEVVAGDYNSWFGDAVFRVELLLGQQHALVCYRADMELRRLKVAQREAALRAKDLLANRTHVEECRRAAAIAKSNGTGNTEFLAAVMKAAPGFREVPVYTKPGEGTFKTYSLNDARQGVDGFRFRMPAEPGFDFICCFAVPEGVSWNIVPIDSNLKFVFTSYRYFNGQYKGFSLPTDWLPILQGLGGKDNLDPGGEYGIWFRFQDTEKRMIPAGFAAMRDGGNYTCKDTIEGAEIQLKGVQALIYLTGFQPPVTNAQTLLDYAVDRQDIAMVKTALERGAQYAKSPSTLIVAARTQNVKFLQELFKTGLQKEAYSETQITSALFLDNMGPEMTEYLVRECGADVGLVVKTQFYGACTALDYAARMGSVEECMKLIELGAKVTDHTIEMAKEHNWKEKVLALEAARVKQAGVSQQRKAKFVESYAKYTKTFDNKFLNDEEKTAAWKAICEELQVANHDTKPGELMWDEDNGRVISCVGFVPGSAGKTMTLDLGGDVKMELVWVPAGEFDMGSNDYYDGEKPVHRVKLTKGFWMGKYEVTQEQWERGEGKNRSQFKGAKNPVDTVSWNDTQEFMKKLNKKMRGGRVRLPTEAEWEYACRAGTKTKFNSGDNDSDLTEVGWYCGKSGKKTHPVGEKKVNAFGLHDMHGNVQEWCQDWYGAYPSGEVSDPTGSSSGSYRVLRGGSWVSDPADCRSAYRSSGGPASEGGDFGFRVVFAAERDGGTSR